MGRKGYKALMLVWCCFFVACKKDKPVSTLVPPPHEIGTGNVYIVCEGQYGYGNASLGLYVPSKDSVYGDIYRSVNGQGLGDVFQSMTHIGYDLLLAVNNSNKIAVIADSNWKLIGNISVPQPRYILSVAANKAYVSTLYSNKIYVIDPAALQVTDSVILPTLNPENMVQYGNVFFSCSWDTSTKNIYQISTTTNEITFADSISGYAAQEILEDAEQKMWVLSGNAPYGKPAFLTRIDPDTRQILKTYAFPAQANPVRPVFNVTKDTLYFIEADYSGSTANNGIFRMGIYDASLPQQPFIAAAQYQYYWALGVDPNSGYIYVGDPKGFTQKGSVSIYKPDGTLVKQFTTGVGPGHFYFD